MIPHTIARKPQKIVTRMGKYEKSIVRIPTATVIIPPIRITTACMELVPPAPA